MASDADRYEAYYAGKLWALLPAMYQAEDSVVVGQRGPLREIVNRIGAQAAVLRRSIDRTWEDQSIESCDDWVIPYIADLLATRLVSSSDPRGRRLDVAKTVYYRSRKGTPAVLEELAADITGWDARVVEFFRRMGRTRHGLDPAIGSPASSSDSAETRALEDAQRVVGRFTRMPTHGIADLRSPNTARLAGTAFDELSYTADMRVGRGATGWYNIPRLGVFLWRLKSYPVTGVTPVPFTGCPHEYTFDPSGRQIPLFAASTRTYGDAWVSPTEQQVPGPISRRLSLASLADLYATTDSVTGATIRNAFGLYTLDTALDTLTLIPEAQVTSDPSNGAALNYYIDPEQGVVYVLGSSPSHPLVTGYHYGFSSEIGAGSYDRRVPGQPPAPAGTLVELGGDSLLTALGAVVTGGGSGVLTIGDSLTYVSVADVTNVGALTIQVGNNLRPLIRIPMPSPPTPIVWTFTGTSGSTLVLDGLWIAGGEIRLEGVFDSVTVSMCTLDPGNEGASAGTYATAVDGRLLNPCRLHVAAQVKSLVINRSITGPILVEGSGGVETMTITDSIVQAINTDPSIDSGTSGVVMMQRSTILGPASVHRVEASSSILHDAVTVTDTQHSCLRFSAWVQGSTAPRQYESPSLLPSASIFTSRRFGDPGYAQLSLFAPAFLADGAEGGSEIGAFSRERGAIKEESLLVKLQEYMPVGLSPVIIYVT